MQTFLPYENFKECAKCLDDRRLNKQIIEAKTIYDTIVSNRKAWRNHPIVMMWRGYPDALSLYFNECLYEWKEIRHKNHKYEVMGVREDKIIIPKWLGDERLHSSHRANLLRKDFEFYSKYGWKECLMDYWKMSYWWGEEYGYGKVPKMEKEE